MKTTVFLAIAVAFLASCSEAPKTEEKALSVPIIILKSRDTIVSKTAVADIQAIKNTEIRARIGGYLEKIMVDEGSKVRKGQPMFQLISPEYQAEYTKAKAALERAQAEQKSACLEVQRMKMLVEKKVVVQTELQLVESKCDVARAAVQEAEAALNNAKVFLSYTTITAPFDGVIDRIPLKAGSLINEGSLLTTLFDESSMYAYFHISERDYLKYLEAKRKGDANLEKDNIPLILADGSKFGCLGRIETIGSQVEGATGAITFRARFNNPQGILKHGSSGTIQLRSDAENVLMLPQKAVMEIQDKNYVYIVDDSNKVKLRSFSIARRVGSSYHVKSGVKENERIVLEGSHLLREGMTIIPVLTRL